MATSERLYQNHPLGPNAFAEISALARDIEELCAAGILEAFRDDDGIIRYRPTIMEQAA